jgi:hypothetical protein
VHQHVKENNLNTKAVERIEKGLDPLNAMK